MLIGILVHVMAILEVIRGQTDGLTRYALMLKNILVCVFEFSYLMAKGRIIGS